ncbi:MAG: ubiquinone/menaquinone biosynthesis methyltransferase [Acidimicrobiales bacterium]|nr:MAG: ubiquinone/menaquinone biosynthesis methyltransferase [Acidimicrobiales bacterium]
MGLDDRWQISGDAAENYDRFVASWFTAWARDLVARAGVGAGAELLDVACGTGVVERVAGPVVGPSGRIVATDLNEDMLAQARRVGAEGASVEWRQADATALPFADAVFDAVLCQQGLQFVPDKAGAVSEMRRVLRLGGVAAVSVWCAPEENPYLSALAEGLRRHVSTDAGLTMLAPCGLGDPEDLSGLFEHAGFEAVEVQKVTMQREPMDAADAVAGNLAALPIAGQITSMEPAAHAAMIDSILAELAPFISDDQLTAPSSANIAVAVAPRGTRRDGG